MSTKTDRPIIPFASAAAWEAWLAEHNGSSDGVWLKIANKASGIPSVTYAEALDMALCYGWIDGQKNKDSDEYWLQLFTPRRPKSRWSQINCGKVTDLIERGKMQPAGLREVEAAKADGRWEAAYGGQASMTIPEDLQRALDQNDAAREFFATLNRTNRFAILYRLHDARRPETRAKRLEQFMAMLSEGKKIFP
jgi:uncharacterized protein YdeI (YjbR/CyaY-like superfamily)